MVWSHSYELSPVFEYNSQKLVFHSKSLFYLKTKIYNKSLEYSIWKFKYLKE